MQEDRLRYEKYLKAHPGASHAEYLRDASSNPYEALFDQDVSRGQIRPRVKLDASPARGVGAPEVGGSLHDALSPFTMTLRCLTRPEGCPGPSRLHLFGHGFLVRGRILRGLRRQIPSRRFAFVRGWYVDFGCALRYGRRADKQRIAEAV
jgi:hypothetical protein